MTTTDAGDTAAAPVTGCPPVTLHAGGLLSRHGFNDGDAPDDLLDWACRHPDPAAHALVDATDWRAVLQLLVREHLVPALVERHELEVYDVETNHNPIRAARVDGADVDLRAGHEIELTPACVVVAGDVVLEAIRRIARR